MDALNLDENEVIEEVQIDYLNQGYLDKSIDVYKKKEEEFRELASVSSEKVKFGIMLKKELENNLNVSNLEMDKKLLEVASKNKKKYYEEEKAAQEEAAAKVEEEEEIVDLESTELTVESELPEPPSFLLSSSTFSATKAILLNLLSSLVHLSCLI